MTHLEENKILFKNYLENYCFKYWRKAENKSYNFSCNLELIISPICNTKCSYCYYKNFGKDLYPNYIVNEKDILNNLEKFLKYLNKNNLTPECIDIFSGEFLNLPYHMKVLEIIEKYVQIPTTIVIPTNGTFCVSDEKTAHAQELLARFNGVNSKLFCVYSLSIDGKYLDNDTRTMRNGTLYTDEFYDRAFKFARENNLMFHPMIGAKCIDKWIDNFNWYVENIKKYWNCSEEEAYEKIYLLEIRNPDWTKEELLELQKFIKYLINKTFNAVNKDKEVYFKNFFELRHLNIFSSFFGTIGRGLGCSIQSTLAIRLGDLALVPCHRTAYKGYNAGYFVLDDDGNEIDFILENPLNVMFIQNFNFNKTSKCLDCLINNLCAGPCLGCNFEVNHDPFMMVEQVCNLEKTKIISMVEAFTDIGFLDKLINILRNSGPKDECSRKAEQLMNLKNYYLESKNK